MLNLRCLCIKCVTIYFADNMANQGQIKMNEMLRRLNHPLICRRNVQGGGNCFYDREDFAKACVTSVLHKLQILMVYLFKLLMVKEGNQNL